MGIMHGHMTIYGYNAWAGMSPMAMQASSPMAYRTSHSAGWMSVQCLDDGEDSTGCGWGGTVAEPLGVVVEGYGVMGGGARDGWGGGLVVGRGSFEEVAADELDGGRGAQGPRHDEGGASDNGGAIRDDSGAGSVARRAMMDDSGAQMDVRGARMDHTGAMLVLAVPCTLPCGGYQIAPGPSTSSLPNLTTFVCPGCIVCPLCVCTSLMYHVCSVHTKLHLKYCAYAIQPSNAGLRSYV